MLLLGCITLAYAAGSRAYWLTASQINFNDKVTSYHGNKLTTTIWDAVMNGLTTRVQNHEKRLQTFAQTVGYSSLTSEQITFTDLLSTKHNNQLTSEMWNSLVTKLTTAITNHEMRLRSIEKAIPISVDGECGAHPGTCVTGTPISDNKANCGARTWSCQGNNEGENQSCFKNLFPCTVPVDGLCWAVAGTCKQGISKNDNQLTTCGSIRRWSCQGNNGGKEKQCRHENTWWKRKYEKTRCTLLSTPIYDNPDELISVKFSWKWCKNYPFGTEWSKSGGRIKSTTHYCKNSLWKRWPACKKHTSSYRNRMWLGGVPAHSEDYRWTYTDKIQLKPFQEYCNWLKKS